MKEDYDIDKLKLDLDLLTIQIADLQLKMIEDLKNSLPDSLEIAHRKFKELSSNPTFVSDIGLQIFSGLSVKAEPLAVEAGLAIISSLTSSISPDKLIDIGKAVATTLSANPVLINEDFVIVDEASIKEFEVPEELAIPIDKNKLKISTNTFLTLIGTIFTILTLVWTIRNDINSSKEQATYYAEQLQLDQERNELIQEQSDLLQKLFQSIDTSNSSQEELLEYIHSAFQEDDLSPDQAPATDDNNPE